MPTRVPIAREGWSGVDHLAVSRDLGDTSRLIELLPNENPPIWSLFGCPASALSSSR